MNFLKIVSFKTSISTKPECKSVEILISKFCGYLGTFAAYFLRIFAYFLLFVFVKIYHKNRDLIENCRSTAAKRHFKSTCGFPAHVAQVGSRPVLSQTAADTSAHAGSTMKQWIIHSPSSAWKKVTKTAATVPSSR